MLEFLSAVSEQIDVATEQTEEATPVAGTDFSERVMMCMFFCSRVQQNLRDYVDVVSAKVYCEGLLDPTSDAFTTGDHSLRANVGLAEADRQSATLISETSTMVKVCAAGLAPECGDI